MRIHLDNLETFVLFSLLIKLLYICLYNPLPPCYDLLALLTDFSPPILLFFVPSSLLPQQI